MFELEVGAESLTRSELPQAFVDAMRETRRQFDTISLTPWEEHCTECAMPDCYSTCDLYAARIDGKCRRFLRGVEIIPSPEHPQGYVAKVSFKRWGQLMAYTLSQQMVVGEATSIERRVRSLEKFAVSLPIASLSVAGRRGIPSRLARRLKQRLVRRSTGCHVAPTSFVVEVFNPGSDVVRLSLTVANAKQTGNPPFQEMIELQPGFRRVHIAVDAMTAFVNLGEELHVTLNPNIVRAEDEGLTLYFGLVAFVTPRQGVNGSTSAKEEPEGRKAGRVVKVAVWDLDNTLWDGTLVEDGIGGLRLREEAIGVVREFDRRGIVNSILSKNNEEDGRAALRHFGIEEYFIFPKIGWTEKGSAMTRLIREFNVDAATFAFIDDQDFERAHVKAMNPDVRVFDSRTPLALIDLPEFTPAESHESSSRRSFYRAEENRLKDHESVGGDYLAFLRTCSMRAHVARPTAAVFDRVQELVQRTNQLNYSGRHYSREEINAVLADPSLESFVTSCEDAYGDYGTVGFVSVDAQHGMLRDAMFSCRIQFKRVEHAILTFLLHRYRAQGFGSFDARFCETKKNAPAAAVFRDLGFRQLSRTASECVYRFDLRDPIPDEGIVTLTYEGTRWEPPAPTGEGP